MPNAFVFFAILLPFSLMVYYAAFMLYRGKERFIAIILAYMATMTLLIPIINFLGLI